MLLLQYLLAYMIAVRWRACYALPVAAGHFARRRASWVALLTHYYTVFRSDRPEEAVYVKGRDATIMPMLRLLAWWWPRAAWARWGLGRPVPDLVWARCFVGWVPAEAVLLYLQTPPAVLSAAEDPVLQALGCGSLPGMLCVKTSNQRWHRAAWRKPPCAPGQNKPACADAILLE